MKIYLGADPGRTREENKIRGEVVTAPAINSPIRFGHDIVHGSSVVAYTDPEDKGGSRLTLGEDYILLFQDAIATDQSRSPCFRHIVFLRPFPWVILDYHAYGDMVGRAFISDVNNALAEHGSRLEALELFAGANLYTAHRYATSSDPNDPPDVDLNADNPGLNWLPERPAVGAGQYLFDVATLWRGGVRLAPWAPPVVISGLMGPTGPTGATGAAGANGQRTAIVTLYKWAASAPTGTWPIGNSVYTWATAAWTDPANLNAWTRSPGVGAAGQTLYAIDLAITDALITATTSGAWSAAPTPYVVGVYGSTGATGAAGANGQRSVLVTLYKWAASVPSGTWPTGNSTYTWATGAWTDPATPNGWSKTPGAGAAGQTLYAVDLLISDNLTGTTTTDPWPTTPVPRAVGVYGSTGATGAAGANGQRTAIVTLYKWAASAPTGTWPIGNSTYTWATAAWTDPANLNAWTRSPGVGAAGQTLYAIDLAITDALTTATTSGAWSAAPTPYVVGVYGSTGATGAAGANGQRSVLVTLYKWAASVPSGTWPTGNSTYTWATGAWTDPATPNGWSKTPGAGAAGQTLYAVDLLISDNLTGATTTGTWPGSPVPRAVGVYGSTGATGAAGANGQRTAIVTLYKWAASAPTGTWPIGNSTYTWATGAWTNPATLNGWTKVPGSGAAGQTLYAIDLTITDALTTATSSGAWSAAPTPYVTGVYGQTGATGAAGENGAQGLGSWTAIKSANVVQVNSTTFRKISGSAAWDSQVYSAEGFQTCSLRFRAEGTTSNIMFGINTDPATDGNWTTLDHAFYLQNSGNWDIRESGATIAVSGSYGPTTRFRITYDATKVRYYVDDILVRTINNAGQTFFLDSSFYTVSATLGIRDISWGQMLVGSEILAGSIKAEQLDVEEILGVNAQFKGKMTAAYGIMATVAAQGVEWAQTIPQSWTMGQLCTWLDTLAMPVGKHIPISGPPVDLYGFSCTPMIIWRQTWDRYYIFLSYADDSGEDFSMVDAVAQLPAFRDSTLPMPFTLEIARRFGTTFISSSLEPLTDASQNLGGVFKTWKGIFLNGSQKVVTGGIHDSGENSNGRWVKFNDGTLIQWGTFTGGDWATTTFPMAFIDTAYVVTINNTSAYAIINTLGTLTTTSFVSRSIYTDSVVSITSTRKWMAIGRWS